MLCKEFETTVEQEGLSPLPMAAQDHLASCDDCQNFFADLNSIVACAHQLPPELDPPQRIWVSLRAQLESEGLLKEPIEGPVEITSEGASSGLRGFRAWFTPRTFATAGVGLALAVAAFIQFQKPPSTNVAMNPSRPVVEQKAFTDPKLSPKPPNGVADEVKQEVATKVTLPSPAESAHPVLKPAPLSTAPSEDFYPAMQAGLNQAELELPQSGLASNPDVEASLRNNLRTVNEFIAECEKHLKKHPQDTLAREYLNSAYQQKAELISALLDSGRSEQ